MNIISINHKNGGNSIARTEKAIRRILNLYFEKNTIQIHSIDMIKISEGKAEVIKTVYANGTKTNSEYDTLFNNSMWHITK